MIATFPSKFLWMIATYGYKQIFEKREMQSGYDLWVGGSAPWTLVTTYCIQFGGLYLRLKLKVGGYTSNLHPPHPMEGCSESGGHPGNNLAKFLLHPRYESRKKN